MLLKRVALGTLRSYNVAFKNWVLYCASRSLHPYSPSRNQVADYFVHIIEKGYKHSSLTKIHLTLQLVFTAPLVRFLKSKLISDLRRAGAKLNPSLPSSSDGTINMGY